MSTSDQPLNPEATPVELRVPKKRAPRKPKDPSAPVGQKGFSKGDPRINRTVPGPGRTAGYKHFIATLTANILDGPTSEKDQTPFVQKAVEKWKKMVIAGDRSAMNAFVNTTVLNPGLLEKLDDILAGQKNKDLKFLTYQLYDRCFDKQQEVLLTKKPTSILICGRRAGKTETLATKIIQTAISHDKGDIVYVGKTYKTAYEIIWKRLTNLLDEINIPYTPLLSEQTITLGSGVVIYVRGANNLVEIDKLRGHSYRLAIVDEIQSIKHLRVLINEILYPAMADYSGSQLFLAGTPPRTKGTYVEHVWESNSKHLTKFHWDLTENMFIPDNEKVLEKVREEKEYTEDNPIYQREWLGKMGIYDVDALVFAPTIRNQLNQDEIKQWMEEQRPNDLFLSAGLDLGHEDSDAFVIILGSFKRPEKWIIHERVKNKQGITELVNDIKNGYEFIRQHPLYRNIPSLENMLIWTDIGGLGKKISYELRNQYGIPTVDAIKTEKSLAIDMLRSEVKQGRLKFDLEGSWADECEKIIYERDENDVLTTTIDDDFHPDEMDAILYAMRPMWRSTDVKLGDVDRSQEKSVFIPQERDFLDDAFGFVEEDLSNQEY